MDKNIVKTLLIEDNLADADYLKEMLSAEKDGSFSILHATRLSQGLELLASGNIGVVLLDLGLPDSQGMNTLLSVRGLSPEVPIIVLTGLADEEFALRAIHSGADEYLLKGQISDTLLVRTIRYAIERKHFIEEMRRSEEQYRLLFDSNPFPMWVYDSDSLSFLAVNNAAVHQYGYSRAEFLGMTIKDIQIPEEVPRLLKLEQELPSGLTHPGVWKQRKKDGTLIDVDITLHDVTFAGKSARLALAKDVTELRKAEETIKYQTYHDLLTGLPNRALLMVRLGLELAQADRNRKKLAILHIDLDRFRLINDSLGHAVGDKVIRIVTERLAGLTRKSDTLARIGSDEFVILLADLKRPEDSASFAQKLVNTMRKPLQVNAHELFTTVSVGISVYPDDGDEPDVLIKNADIAVSTVKDWGRNNYQFFNPALNRRTVERLLLESYLRQSLERGEIEVHYQPQVSIKTGKMIGVEALSRWKHPELGMLQPSQFIPVAEEIGFIGSIDEWVLRTAAAQSKAWLDSGLSPVCMTVNISAQQFQQPGFVQNVKTILNETGLDPEHLDIEITESAAMRDIERSVPNLEGLHELGIDLSIDDFGTGYSSLSYLKRLPVNKLKIDQSFIEGIAEDKDDQAIVRAVIAMGHNLNLKVIAEGVETPEQLSFLRSSGCDEMQGYLYSKPLPAEDMKKILTP